MVSRASVLLLRGASSAVSSSGTRTAMSLLPNNRLLDAIQTRGLFENGILRSDQPDLNLKLSNVTDHLIGNSAVKFGEDIAVECSLTGQRNSYRDLWEEIKACAAGFTHLGVKRGDVVVVSLANGPLFPKVSFALAYLGATVSLLNPMYTPYEIERILRLTGAKAVITQEMLLPNLMQAMEAMPKEDKLPPVFVDNYAGGDSRVLNLSNILTGHAGFTPEAFDYKTTTAFMPFSSGTTGPPKGVQLSHFAMTSAVDVQSKFVDLSFLRDSNGMLTIIPNFHIYGLMHVTGVLLSAGVKMLTLPVFDYGLFLQTLLEKRPGGMTLVPPLAARLAADPEVTADHLSSLKFASCGGAPLPPAVAAALLAKSPSDLQLWMGYGMTECPSIASGVHSAKGSTGKVTTNVSMRFVESDTGRDVEPGQKGEICVQAPHLMQGYFKNPTATAEMFMDGWMKTGDVGYCDDEGNVFVVDRKKDLIKHKGFQVSPSELEEVILEVPGVAEVCVVGVEDDRYGEVPRAFVVAKEGHQLTESQIHGMVDDRLSAYKRLRGGVQFVGALPTSPTGKVLRRALRN